MKQHAFDLDAKKKHKVIQNYLNTVMDSNPSYYYAPTTQIAHLVHELIMQNVRTMPVEEQAMFQSMTPEDVHVILSYSSCC